MDTTASLPNDYWRLVKDLSDDMKIELISRLSDSLLRSRRRNQELSASRFYGVWKDDDMADADELAKEIKESRQFKDDVEAF